MIVGQPEFFRLGGLAQDAGGVHQVNGRCFFLLAEGEVEEGEFVLVVHLCDDDFPALEGYSFDAVNLTFDELELWGQSPDESLCFEVGELVVVPIRVVGVEVVFVAVLFDVEFGDECCAFEAGVFLGGGFDVEQGFDAEVHAVPE